VPEPPQDDPEPRDHAAERLRQFEEARYGPPDPAPDDIEAPDEDTEELPPDDEVARDEHARRRRRADDPDDESDDDPDAAVPGDR